MLPDFIINFDPNLLQSITILYFFSPAFNFVDVTFGEWHPHPQLVCLGRHWSNRLGCCVGCWVNGRAGYQICWWSWACDLWIMSSALLIFNLHPSPFYLGHHNVSVRASHPYYLSRNYNDYYYFPYLQCLIEAQRYCQNPNHPFLLPVGCHYELH